ncbi:response regulator [Niveispirillum sp.]|uniref:response regulator n=1 Tax=Niveispirillum sp. TaxID=1917217 RepID=UPI001B5DD9BF|nr:response regulator [Niveispirillum sp.]MBP7339303.1 response regulator [Niveispirillum sp.]
MSETTKNNAQSGFGTILVVEDEALVRMALVESLSDLGHEVLEAQDGHAALDILHGPVHLDLLITDLGLPGMDGRQVAAAGRKRQPDLKVLFLTGYGDNPDIRRELGPNTQLAGKPIGFRTLMAQVNSLLNLPARPAAAL